MKTSRLLLLSLFSVLLVSRGLAQFDDDDDDDYADSRDPVTAVPDGNQNVWIDAVGNDDEPTPAPAVQEETTEATAEETTPVDAPAVPDVTDAPTDAPTPAPAIQEETTEAPSDAPTPAPAVQLTDEETTPYDAPAVPDVTDAPTDAPTPALAVQEETTDAAAEETTPVDAAAVPEETTEAPAPAVQATGEETTPDSAPAVPDVTDAPTPAPVQISDPETTPDSAPNAPAVPEETTEDPFFPFGTVDGETPGPGSPIETTEASADVVTTPDAAPVATNVDTTANPSVVILSGSDATTTDSFGLNGAPGSGSGGSPNAGSVDTTTVDPSSFNGGFAGFNPNKKPTWTIDEIDPKVLASLSDRNLKLDRVPGYLKDGRRTDEMLDDEWMMSDFSNGEFPQREVNSKEGQYVLSAVQTKGNNVVYDPFTIGQVLGYLYEYNEFSGNKPAGGWTLEMFGKQLPTWIRKKREAKTRRATLIFKKKPEVIAKEEEAYWKQFMSSI